jgi:hypothetical protein
MRYRLRTLLVVLAVLPPVLAGAWWMWIRGGLFDAIDIVAAAAAFVWAVAAIHFAIKRNLGY